MEGVPSLEVMHDQQIYGSEKNSSHSGGAINNPFHVMVKELQSVQSKVSS